MSNREFLFMLGVRCCIFSARRVTNMEHSELLAGWISYLDSTGPKIDPLVVEAAYALLPAAVSYSQGNPTEAVETLARSAFEVSKFVFRNGLPAVDKNGQQIRDMKDYLYRGYMKKANHRVKKRSKSDAALVSLEVTREVSDGGSSKRVMENDVLFERLYGQMDPKLQVIFYWREIEGWHWKQVGKAIGMKPHAAKVYYLRGLQRLARLVYEGSNVVPIDQTRNQGKAGSEM